MSIVKAITHTEAVLYKLSKSELVQLVVKTEASLASQITNLTTEVKDLLVYFKKQKAFSSYKECKFKTYGEGSAD